MAADITKLLAHLLLEIDTLTPVHAVAMIREWYSARRAELQGRWNRLALVEEDLRAMNRWIEQQLTHPDPKVRAFWTAVRADLLFRRPEHGDAI